MSNAKTFGDDSSSLTSYDPLDSMQRESVERMKQALISAQLDEPSTAAAAIRQVTILRAYHQVTRIVKYLDLMDQLESKLYETIEFELADSDDFEEDNFKVLTKLLAVQEKLQKSMIESNKLLQPFLDTEQYGGAFDIIEANEVKPQESLIPVENRNEIRDSAGQILKELTSLSKQDDKKPVEVE